MRVLHVRFVCTHVQRVSESLTPKEPADASTGVISNAPTKALEAQCLLWDKKGGEIDLGLAKLH